MGRFEITSFLSDGLRNKCWCALCGTDKSVKYLVTMTEQSSGEKRTVCSCNTCALRNGVFNMLNDEV